MASASTDIFRHLGLDPYQESEDETYMNPQQEAHFRALLEAWRQSLMEDVDRTVASIQSETEPHADPSDRATQESDIGMELRTRERERKLLSKITKALHALDDHAYGYCERCGAEIGIRRLEARPTAELCIDCKTREEVKEKSFN